MYLRPVHLPLSLFATAMLSLGWVELVFNVWGCAVGMCEYPKYNEVRARVCAHGVWMGGRQGRARVPEVHRGVARACADGLWVEGGRGVCGPARGARGAKAAGEAAGAPLPADPLARNRPARPCATRGSRWPASVRAQGAQASALRRPRRSPRLAKARPQALDHHNPPAPQCSSRS